MFKLLNTIFFIFLSLILFSQELKFDVLGEKDGLSQNTVTKIIKDEQGFMWFGTQDGLNRFDGQNFKVFKYDPLDTNSLSGNDIKALFQDKEGIIWVGTSNGLNEYNPVLNKITRYYFKDNTIKCINQNKDGIIWFGTNDGVFSYDKTSGKSKQYRIGENCGGCNKVTDIEFDSNGRIWVGTYNTGLYFSSLNYSTFEKITFSGNNEETDLNINDIKLYGKDILLVATGNGLRFIDILNREEVNYLSPETNRALIRKDIKAIAIGSKDNILIENFGSYIYKFSYSNNKIGNIDIVKRGTSNYHCLYVDDLNNIWTGATSIGVEYFIAGKTYFNSYYNPLTSIYSFLVDTKNSLLVGSTEGLISFENRNTAGVRKVNSQAKSTLCLYENELQKCIWLGVLADGIKVASSNLQKIENLNSERFELNTVTILDIKEITEDVIYIGTTVGVFIFDISKKSYSKLDVLNGLSDNYVSNIIKGSDNMIWIGTNKGISIYNLQTGKFKYYSAGERMNQLSSNTVLSILEDKTKKIIWVGTELGLNKIDLSTDQITKYYQKDGLPNDVIYGILQDEGGNLWMSTNKGICKFNPNKENINGTAFTCYTVEDGLPCNEYNQGAYYKAPDGELYFGGVSGYVSFYPENIKENTTPPKIFLSNFKLQYKDHEFDTSMLYKQEIKFDYDQNFISFDFGAIDYVKPKALKFSWMLEGLDEDWRPLESKTDADYPKLDPGEYVFKVKAMNNSGVWGKDEARIKIFISPPWYKTKAAYFLGAFILVSGVFGFSQFRTYKVRRENKILEERVSIRTKELAQKNRDITASITYAKKIQEAILPDKEDIYKHFSNVFILYKPKDIVSGDFYWFGEKNGKKIIAVVDCTGHGVPGAFMSMIGHNLLHQLIMEEGVTDPGCILSKLHVGVQKSLKQAAQSDTHDGMDAAIAVFDYAAKNVLFAGANRPLIKIFDGQLEKIPGNKFPIGGSQIELNREFTTHVFELKKEESYYLFSDGYADQFGGPEGKKFMFKRMMALLLSMQNKSMYDQGQQLNNEIAIWQGGDEQVDDILVIGIKV